MFAPTPPLESLRIVLSLAATWTEGTLEHNRREDSEDRSQISFIDIARAYFCAKTDPERPTYVELPLKEEGSGSMCGLLLRHMYGTRAAADGWHGEYASTLVEKLGFDIGNGSACAFWHWKRSLR